MANLKETGGFSINGKWATRVAYEADLDSGLVSRIDLRFVIGRSLVAQAQLSRADALEILGYKNLAAIEEAATARKEGTQERIKGELRGRTLQYRQATLTGAQPQSQDNSIEHESLSASKEQAGSRVGSSETASAVGERGSPERTGAEATDMPASPASPEARRLPQRSAVPEEIARRFLRVDNEFYFTDRSLAFVDRGTSLKTASENLEVVRALVAIAQARGWEAIRVNGTESFRSLVWREATRQGLPVRGYTPTDVERAEVEREPVRRDSTTADSNPLNEVRRDSRQRDHEAAEGTRRRERTQREARAPRREFVVGKLVDHGRAPYQFDQKKARSYFVTLETPLGLTARWGADLNRAFAESRTRPKIGDEIGLEFHGARAVRVKADVLDEAGRVIGQREVTKHRNSWVVEKREYFEQRTLRAQALRDERRGKEEIARAHPQLAGALATVHLAELFASKNFSTDPDRTRFVKLVRDAVARAIEHEVPVPAPKLRETRTHTHSRDAQRGKAGTGPDRQSGREPPAMERV